VRAFAAAVAALVVCATTSAAPPPGVDWLITADRLFDGRRMVADGAVAITGGRIVAVGEEARGRDAGRVRRFDNATIMPGLVDLHVHALGCGQLASAITTVRDLASSLASLPVRQRPRAPHVVAAGPFVTAPGGYPIQSHGASLAYVVRDAEEARGAVRTLVRRGAGVIKVGLTETFPNLSLEELRAIVDEAHDAGARVSAHVEDSAGAKTALAAGVDDFAHMPSQRDPALMMRLAQARMEIVGTLHVISGFRPAAVLANARAFVRAGGTLLYGSDFGNPGIPIGVDGTELQLMSKAGLSRLDVLRSATSRAGAVLGRPDIGRLRPGASADVVVVRGNPSADLRVVSSVPNFLLVRGRAVVDGTRLNAPAFC
jgi:imidazolonepropionase-like amidohydrolase